MAETAEGGTEVGSGGEVGERQSSFPGAVFKSSLCHFLSPPPPTFTQEEGKAQKNELPKVTHPVEPGPEGSVWNTRPQISLTHSCHCQVPDNGEINGGGGGRRTRVSFAGGWLPGRNQSET